MQGSVYGWCGGVIVDCVACLGDGTGWGGMGWRGGWSLGERLRFGLVLRLGWGFESGSTH